jgi:hypothetical protein
MNAIDERSKPFWASIPAVPAKPLMSALSVDVVIIGSGIARQWHMNCCITVSRLQFLIVGNWVEE